MLLRFETLSEKKLVGQCINHPDFSVEETSRLWRAFRSQLSEILPEKETHLYSVQFHENAVGNISQRWAAAEVPGNIPEGMKALKIPQGLYAVFLYRGGRNGFEEFMKNQIFHTIPAYGMQTDFRPWFQLMGKGFNPFSDDSEEEVWIPLCLKDTTEEHRLRSIAAMSALLSRGHQMMELRNRFSLALETGFNLSDLKEIILQVCLYAGFPRSLNGMACLRGLMEERNQHGQKTALGKEPSPQPEGKTRYELGWETLQSLDPDFILRLKAGLDPIAPELFSMVLEHGYADIFYRDNLDIRQREVAVVAAMVAVENADPQLSFHIMAGMGTGISRELMKAIITTAAAAAGKDAAHALSLLEQIR